MDSLKQFDIKKMSVYEVEEHLIRLKEVRDNGSKKQRLMAAMDIAEIKRVIREPITKIYNDGTK